LHDSETRARLAVGRNGIPSSEILPSLPRWLVPRSRKAIQGAMPNVGQGPCRLHLVLDHIRVGILTTDLPGSSAIRPCTSDWRFGKIRMRTHVGEIDLSLRRNLRPPVLVEWQGVALTSFRARPPLLTGRSLPARSAGKGGISGCKTSQGKTLAGASCW